jgi:superoxide dismutase, Fe-Mn family
MNNLTRREMLELTGVGAGLCLARCSALDAAQEKKPAFTLPPLPYAYDALEPHIDAETMKIHHDRHHQAYVTNLNAVLKDLPDLLAKPVDELLHSVNQVPESVRQKVIDNGGGHANHTLFWTVMGPKAGGTPSGELGKAIDQSFGSFTKLQEAMSNAALTRFGSGWAWLMLDNGKLVVQSLPNQDSPLLNGKTPLLGLDVWEHAYYLKYQNKRADYVKAWWNVVQWDHVAERYTKAKQ